MIRLGYWPKIEAPYTRCSMLLPKGFEVTLGSYPNGDPYIKIEDDEVLENLSGDILVQAENLGEFMAAMFLVDALEDRGKTNGMTLYIPFLPGSRQDRRFTDGGDLLFAAKSVAQTINDRVFKRVITWDTHSDVPVGMIDRCENIPAADLFVPSDLYRGVIIPDAGAEKRGNGVAKRLGVERVVHAWKHRDVKTGALTGFGMEPCGPGHYLVVDDICDGGGTFLGLAGEIDRQGATADLYVTHGIFSQGTERLLEKYGKVYTTDSINSNPVGVTVIPATKKIFR